MLIKSLYRYGCQFSAGTEEVTGLDAVAADDTAHILHAGAAVVGDVAE